MGKEAFKRFDKVPDVSRIGMLTNHLDDIGESMQVLEDVTTMVEYCAAYDMGHITMGRSSICSLPAHLPKNSQNCGKHCTELHQPALPAEGRVARSTWCSSTSSPLTVLRLTSASFFRWLTAFSCNVRGFKAMWCDHGMSNITKDSSCHCEIVTDDTLALDADFLQMTDTLFVQRAGIQGHVT